jgi:hypothetical protein
MPSVKSYQNRKSEIAQLKSELAEINRKYTDLVNEVYAIETNARVAREIVVGLINHQVMNKDRIQTLESQVRIYRDYIRRAYCSHALQATFLEEIPSCLKPLDAIKYSGERINNGPDNLPQQLP